jgi:hypothetical protein
MKLTTMTQVTIDGVMQGNGGASDDRRNRFERGGWARGRATWRGVRDEDGPITGDFDQLRMPAETGFVSSNVIERKGQSNSTPE